MDITTNKEHTNPDPLYDAILQFQKFKNKEDAKITSMKYEERRRDEIYNNKWEANEISVSFADNLIDAFDKFLEDSHYDAIIAKDMSSLKNLMDEISKIKQEKILLMKFILIHRKILAEATKAYCSLYDASTTSPKDIERNAAHLHYYQRNILDEIGKMPAFKLQDAFEININTTQEI